MNTKCTSDTKMACGLQASVNTGASRLIRFALITALLLLSPPVVLAQNLHEQAQQQTRSGDIAGMADTYLEILEQNPEDVSARLGYATALSWLGRHEAAQKQYNEVLTLYPENLDALSGLGYSFAWAGQYARAEMTFNRASSLAPDNIGIQKGLAFTYLWSKQPEKALNILNSLENRIPQDAEVHAAKGQALAALGRNDAAAAAFRVALKIDPNREDAQNGLNAIEQGEPVIDINAIEQGEPIFDISAWFGSTSDGGGSGLREITLGYKLENDSRLWFRFDDSLSLDNPALARSGESAETIFVGFQGEMKSNLLGIFEIGNRDLPANADQQIYKFEVVSIQSPRFYKLGIQLSPHSDNYTDKLIYTSVGYPLNNAWRLEPTLYLSSSGAIDDKEFRAVVFAEYLAPARWSIGLGAGVGRIMSDKPVAEGSVSTANVLFSYPLDQKTRLNLSIRHEDSPTNSFSTALAGITVQLP